MSTTTWRAPRQPSIRLATQGLLSQLFYLTPLFWLLELAQNVAWRWVNGSWGWVYPASPHGWFSFGSMVLWASAVGLMWSLHTFWFEPRQVPLWRRIVSGAAITWVGEWVGGFLAVLLTGEPMQVWPGASLVYVSYPAFFFWVSNVTLYFLLTLDRAALERAQQGAPRAPRAQSWSRVAPRTA
jgi:hypothetical protein